MPGARILVVEDEAIEALDIQQRLTTLGYNVLGISGTGEEGVRKATELHPDLVLMDIMLPGGMDGIQAAGEIRSRLDIPVIFLTAYGDEATLQRAKITEPYGYVIKPFQERELHIAIEIAVYKHQTERKLHDSEQRYRELVELSPDCIAISSEGRIIFVNSAGVRLFGAKSAEEMIGKPVMEIVHPDYRQIVSERLKQLTEEHKVAPLIEEKLLRLDGSALFVDAISMPHSYQGKPAFVSVIRDISERKRLQDELNQYHLRLEEMVGKRTAEFAQANARLEQEIEEHKRAEESLALRASIMDYSRDVMFLLNPEGYFAFANKAARETYGYSESEFLKMNLRQLLPPQDANLIGPRLKQVIEKGQLEVEAVHLRKDGTTMKVRVYHSLLKTQHGQFIVSVLRPAG